MKLSEVPMSSLKKFSNAAAADNQFGDMGQIYQNIKCHSDTLPGVDKLISESLPTQHRHACDDFTPANLDLFFSVTLRQGRIMLSVPWNTMGRLAILRSA